MAISFRAKDCLVFERYPYINRAHCYRIQFYA